MALKVMMCPACSHPLPEETKPNELTTCPACGATLYLSDWEVGKHGDGVVVATPTRVYTITDLLGRDDLCNIYRCAYSVEGIGWQGMFRAARDPQDNDLVQNEGQTLYYLQTAKDYDDFYPFLPAILESFLYHDSTLHQARHVNIFGLHEEISGPNQLYSLEEIHKYYPSGIDPRDMAWMWRRLLYVLGFAHQAGVVHGGVLPTNVLIEPKDHKLVLSGWGYAVRDALKTGTSMKAVSVTYEDWYPQTVFKKQPPTPTLDLAMGARCMMYLIGADPLDDTPQQRNMEKKMARYFAKCIDAQPRDAWGLLAEFDRLIEGLWGPRTFRVFTMPYKS